MRWDSPHLLGELTPDAGLRVPHAPGKRGLLGGGGAGSWGGSFWKRREGQRLEGQHQDKGPVGAEVGMEQEWVGARPGVRESGEGRLRSGGWDGGVGWRGGSQGLHAASVGRVPQRT